jgi:hypothetical protein
MIDDDVWNWGGKFFGWTEAGELITHDGRHVGRFCSLEVFAKTGAYLGEIKNHRLITNLTKKHTKTQPPFIPQMKVLPPPIRIADDQALDMPSGYEEFPLPETL